MNIVSRCLRIWEPLLPACGTALPMLASLESEMKLPVLATLPVPNLCLQLEPPLETKCKYRSSTANHLYMCNECISKTFLNIKNYFPVLERWLSGWEQVLLLQRNGFSSQHPPVTQNPRIWWVCGVRVSACAHTHTQKHNFLKCLTEGLFPRKALQNRESPMMKPYCIWAAT